MSLTFVNSWRYAISTIIFLASLASVPEEEYEAARVDGAYMASIQITFPNLLPTLTVLGLVEPLGLKRFRYHLDDDTRWSWSFNHNYTSSNV